MINKIKAAKDALVDPDILLIARTDAIAVNGLEDALERGASYTEAGADILFIEAPVSISQMREISAALPGVHHVANMVEGGKTPILNNAELESLGYKIALYANAPLKAAIHGTKKLLGRLRETGTTANCDDLMISMSERNAITGLQAMDELEMRFRERS